jgi:hypothetical protein
MATRAHRTFENLARARALQAIFDATPSARARTPGPQAWHLLSRGEETSSWCRCLRDWRLDDSLRCRECPGVAGDGPRLGVVSSDDAASTRDEDFHSLVHPRVG